MSSATVSPVRLALADEGQEEPQEKKRLPLLGDFLREQQDLSAVERFSQLHEDANFPLQERFYRDLIPATPPGPGQQYAFEVDLDRCSGCKACVTACHSLNGLDEQETWRSVGLLHGGSSTAPVQKTVTTACHHCLEPACLKGCPVKAYEKDPETGIVRHLDDQCIGCQYCIFTCPYEVPQFNADKGIVRKCDMCSDRLSAGEAPACVQACPNEAIAIRLVDQRTVEADAQADAFLPGAPSPGVTLPTTNYKTAQPLPRNLLPADFFSVHSARQHMPLVVTLVLTQLAAGAFAIDRVLPFLLSESTVALVRPVYGVFALSLALLALAASTSHLGRPQYAFRAVLGLRTSWLSREIVAFGAFAGSALLYAATLLLRPPGLEQVAPALGAGTAAIGLVAVFTSVMVYYVTGRRWWSFDRTATRFFGTAALLGLATVMCSTFAAAFFQGETLAAELTRFGRLSAVALASLTALKLAAESSALLHLRDKQHGDIKRSALLLSGELARETALRLGLGAFGGILLPLATLTQLDASDSALALGGCIVSLMLLLAGELLERMGFFAALSSPRMPGSLR